MAESGSSRRSSSRIKKLAEDQKAKRLLSPPVQEEEEADEKPMRRCSTSKKNKKQKKNDEGAASPPPEPAAPEVGTITTTTTTTRGADDDDDDYEGDVINAAIDDQVGVVVRAQRGDKAQVIETIRTFNKHYLHFVQEEEKRVNIREAERKIAKDLKAKDKGAQDDEIKRGSKRPDLKAITKMRETKANLNPTKRLGSIPGIDVGHQFFSRAEMVIVGFHSHWLNGIDYIGETAGKKYKGFKLPLAIAIVLSGQYEDDLDNCEDVTYTGQGGNDLLGKKHQISDQVMKRGNLALKNCIEQKTPVRVIRGHQSRSSYVGKVYTYDGLYTVHKYWAEKGVSGFTVFKFGLKRLEGQPQLTTNQVHFTNGRVPTSIADIRGLVCEDITGGLEAIPIPATNMVDDPPVPPTDYIYRKSMQVAKNVKLPKAASGCGCIGSCTDPKKCACARLNGSDFPYVQHGGGRLIEPSAVVFECGPNCGCGPGCVNRTSQRGIRFRLEVFRTPKKGWGVRSWDYIPMGSPVCEYIGTLMKTEDTDNAHDNFYLFDIDCFETMNGLNGRQRRLRDVSLPAHMQRNENNREESDPEFCIDASKTGNITRYINHSCQPNLFVQCVVSSHHDLRQARIVLFAADNIPPLQELTYDYAYIIDSVMGADGRPKQVACYCGVEDCRKRLL